ncbi:unnamed protein product [Leuciscus chuanchicus]
MMKENSSSGQGKTSWSELKDLVKGRRLCVEGKENEEKKEGDGETHRWVLNPRSNFRHYYLVYMVVLTFVNLITIPLDVAFSDDMPGSAHKYWVAFNVFSDLLFCVDVGLHFRMGIFSEDEISFLFGGRQLATVSALTTCSLFTLSLQEFQEIEEEFPHVVNELRGAAQQRKNYLERDRSILRQGTIPNARRLVSVHGSLDLLRLEFFPAIPSVRFMDQWPYSC